MKTPVENPLPSDDSTHDEFPDLPEEDRELMNALRQSVQEVQPDARFAAQLEEELHQTRAALPQPVQTSRAGRFFGSTARTIGWGLAILLLMLGLGWSIQNLRPVASAPAAVPSTIGPTSVQSYPTPTQGATSPTTSPELPKSTPASSTPAGLSSPFFPGDTLVLQSNFPEVPLNPTVYQLVSGPKLTIDNILAKAHQLGVDGHVYKANGEGNGPVFVVSDGLQRILFLGSADTFFYDSNYITAAAGTLALPAVDVQTATAETWLKARNLLDFPYKVTTDPGQPGLVQFERILDGFPMRYGQNRPVSIRVSIDEHAKVKRVEFVSVPVQAVGPLPIRSAAQAWDDLVNGPSLLNNNGPDSVEITRGGVFTSNVQTWGRTYPLGKPIEMFGYLSVLPAAEAGVPPEITFNNYPLTGDTSNLLQVNPVGQFLQILGTMDSDATGKLSFRMNGWQTSAFSDDNQEGTIERDGTKAYLNTAAKRLLLADLPGDVPTGLHVSVRGVVIDGNPPELDWMYVQTGATSSGGGGGGGGFHELNLTGAVLPTPTIVPFPKEGERVDGLIGYPTMIIHQFQNGTHVVEYNIALDYSNSQPELGHVLTLASGSGLAGIENYLKLPVKVWGQITFLQNGKPGLSVERFEPEYPGLHYQLFVGKYEIVNLDNQTVLRFVTQDNQVYVLKSSLQYGAAVAVGRPGDLILVEGLAYPGDTFAGYPLITEAGSSVVTSNEELNHYKIAAAQPEIITETTPPPGLQLVIKDIELVYYTPDLRGVGQNIEASGVPMYIQPAWRFSGTYSDGTPVEILVQAAASQFLK